MKNNPIYKRIIIVGVSLLGLILLSNLGLNAWVNYKLPEIISEKNNTPYHITYHDLDFSVFSRYIKASKIAIAPKLSLNDTINKAGIYSQIKSIEINDFSIWSILFDNKITAKSITILEPEVILYKKNRKAINSAKSIGSEVVDPFRKIIAVKDVDLKNGDFKIIYVKDNTPILSVSNISIQLNGILITDETLKKRIPFSYSRYDISCDSIYFLTNSSYHIKANKIQTTDSGFKATRFAMASEYNRKEFVQNITNEKDQFVIKAEDILIENMQWGFKNEAFFFNSTAVKLDNVYANIYRNKMPDDDLSKKPLYNKLLREIPFALQIDTLAIKNSLLEYEEEKTFQKGAGLLTFNKFNLLATNIYSGFEQKKLPDTKIKINCRFMNASPMKVDWSWNSLDKRDGFNIKGSILNFDTNQLSPFTRPYVNATTKGVFDKVYFNFTGNDNIAKGDFALEYHDLKVKLYKKKKPGKESKLKSAIGNLLIKNDSNGKIKSTEIEVERIKEKSFYNFLWRCLAEGIKKILI